MTAATITDFRRRFPPRAAGRRTGRRLPARVPSAAARRVTSRCSRRTITDGKFAPNAFIRIDADGTTTLVMPQVEMGQGIYTASR